jgi:hypothetical protein
MEAENAFETLITVMLQGDNAEERNNFIYFYALKMEAKNASETPLSVLLQDENPEECNTLFIFMS